MDKTTKLMAQMLIIIGENSELCCEADYFDREICEECVHYNACLNTAKLQFMAHELSIVLAKEK